MFNPRIHLEGNDLHIEPNLKESIKLKEIKGVNINEFSDINLFFGGGNAVSPYEAVADPRRGGCAIKC